MYTYDPIDQRLVDERVVQYRDQLKRHLSGLLSEDDFRPLRLQNGLYLQRHAPMLRIAIPYGQLSSAQLRALADIAQKYSRSEGHFSTRQNLQLNWPTLENSADILEALARVQMHAIQTSGNCIRNTTTDQFAGVAADEFADPRPTCELIRQWSTFHPEFAYLPRKFKIALNGAATDRAAILAHDIGIELVDSPENGAGYKIFAGGGLGRTPVIGHLIREFLPRAELLNYLDALLRVYNRYGRRDNKYKARIKILVRELTPSVFAAEVEKEWSFLRGGEGTVPDEEFTRLERAFAPPDYLPLPLESRELRAFLADSKPFAAWHRRNVQPHKQPGYASVTLSLKATGTAPGDLSADQMRAVADLADSYGFGEVRVSHEQNLIFPGVEQRRLHALWEKLRELKLATPNIGLLTDIICCPGGDYCSLANAKSLPVADAIQRRVEDRLDALDYLHDIGELDLNISGCINACGHHHIGHIGILGVDKNGEEWYQVTIGGNQGNDARIGKVIGPSFAREQVASVVEKLLEVYLERRIERERFVDTVQRLGVEPFKTHVYRESAHAPIA